MDPKTLKVIGDTIACANKRLALFGLFRLDDPSPTQRRRFCKNADPTNGIYKLNAQTLFDELKPELRFISDEANPLTTITIADLKFLSYSALTPLQAKLSGKPTKAMPILKNSHLLDKLQTLTSKETETRPTSSDPSQPEPTPFESIQKIGGELFRELIENLDRQVGFDHPHFASGLARILHVYVPVKANTKLPDGELISATALQRQLTENIGLRGGMIKFLLCLEDDEAGIRKELVSIFTGIAQDTEDPVFKPGDELADEEVRAQQIGKILEALKDLKSGLDSDSRSTRDYLLKQAGPWINDVSLNPVYDFKHPSTGKANDIFSLYREAKKASDWVARFVRTEPLHSFVFCWLASKYVAHKEAGVGAAANKMFQVGILGQKGNRVIAQSRRDISGYMDIIDASADQVQQKSKDEAKTHLAVVKERLKLYFLPPNAYTREKQLKRAVRLFVTACQLAGGVTEEIHRDNMKFSDDMNKIQQPLLKYCAQMRREANVKSDDQVELSADVVKKFLKEKVPSQSEFIDRVFLSITKVTAQSVKKQFVKSFADEVLTHFSTKFDSKYSEILKEEAVLRRLFGLWCGVSLEGKGEFAGLTNLVALKTLPREMHNDVSEEILLEKQTKYLTALATQGKSKFKAKPREADAEMPGDGAAEGQAVDQEQVTPVQGDEAKAVEVPDATTAEQKPEDPTDNPAEIADEDQNKSQRDSGNEGETPISFNVVDLAEVAQKETRESAQDFDLLVKKLELCHEKYCEKSNMAAALQRIMRASKLAQVVLASPEDTVNLEARDLSNSIGMIQELVEKLGAPRESLYDNAPTAAGTPAAERIKDVNISDVYALADEDSRDMEKILDYHYRLCTNLNTVSEYLREVRELRDYFDAVSESELDIEIVNRSILEFTQIPRTKPDKLFYDNAPLAVYASVQSAPNPDALRALSDYLGRLMGNPVAPKLQFPAVFLATGAGKAPNGVLFPVFASDEIKFPAIEQVVGSGRIQDPPILLWASALLGGGPCNFGIYPGEKVVELPVSLYSDLQDLKLPSWDVNTLSVYQYLRCTWQDPASAFRNSANEIILLKWRNLGLLQGVIPGKAPEGLQHPLTTLYGPAASNDSTGRPLFQTVFDGLPVGQEKLKVQVKPGGVGASVDVFNNASIPGSVLLIDDVPIVAAWF